MKNLSKGSEKTLYFKERNPILVRIPGGEILCLGRSSHPSGSLPKVPYSTIFSTTSPADPALVIIIIIVANTKKSDSPCLKRRRQPRITIPEARGEAEVGEEAKVGVEVELLQGLAAIAMDQSNQTMTGRVVRQRKSNSERLS